MDMTAYSFPSSSLFHASEGFPSNLNQLGLDESFFIFSRAHRVTSQTWSFNGLFRQFKSPCFSEDVSSNPLNLHGDNSSRRPTLRRTTNAEENLMASSVLQITNSILWLESSSGGVQLKEFKPQKCWRWNYTSTPNLHCLASEKGADTTYGEKYNRLNMQRKKLIKFTLLP